MDQLTHRRTPVFINTIPRPHVRDQTLGAYRATQILSQIYQQLPPKRQRKARRLFLQATFGNAPLTGGLYAHHAIPALLAPLPSQYAAHVEAGDSGGSSNYELTSGSAQRRRRRNRQMSAPQILSMAELPAGEVSDLAPPQSPMQLSRSSSGVFADESSSSDIETTDEEPTAYESSSAASTIRLRSSSSSSSLATTPRRRPSPPSNLDPRGFTPRQYPTQTPHQHQHQHHYMIADNDQRYLDGVQNASLRLLQIDILDQPSLPVLAAAAPSNTSLSLANTSHGSMGQARLAWIQEWQGMRGMGQEVAEREFSEYMRVLMLQHQREVRQRQRQVQNQQQQQQQQQQYQYQQ